MRLAFIISIAVLTALISTTNATMILAFRTTLTKDKEPPRKVTVLVADLLKTVVSSKDKKMIDEWHTFHHKIHVDYYFESADPYNMEQYEGPPKVFEFDGILVAFTGEAEPEYNIRQQKPEISALKSKGDKIDLIASLLYNDKENRPWDTSAIVVTPFGHISLLEAVDGVKKLLSQTLLKTIFKNRKIESLNLPFAIGYGREVVLNQINTLFSDENAPHTVEQLKNGLRQIFHKLMVFQRKAEYLFASENFSGFAIDDKGQTFLLEDFSNPTDVRPFVDAYVRRLVPPGPRQPLTSPHLPYFKGSIKPRSSSKENRQEMYEII